MGATRMWKQLVTVISMPTLLMRCQIISPHLWLADKWLSWSPTSRAVSTLCQVTRQSSNCHRLASWRLAGILQLGKTWSSQSICSHALAVILCHPDKKQVADDEAVIRQMEIDGSLFKLA